MISSKYGFIYLHVPKTGGNSIHTLLLPFSDDQLVLSGHQDGKERFDVRGEITPHKHASLAEYDERLGNRLEEFQFVISVRHPFERALSFYFSPHRWMRQTSEGSFVLTRPHWDLKAFMKLIQFIPPASAYLALGGELRQPAYVLHLENLAADFDNMAKGLDLPLASDKLVHVNRSAAVDGLKAELLGDESLRERVETHFALDMEIFGYLDKPLNNEKLDAQLASQE